MIVPAGASGDGMCARCNRPIKGRHARYTMHDEKGFKFTIVLHRACAISYANILLRDCTRSGGIFDGEARVRSTLEALDTDQVP